MSSAVAAVSDRAALAQRVAPARNRAPARVSVAPTTRTAASGERATAPASTRERVRTAVTEAAPTATPVAAAAAPTPATGPVEGADRTTRGRVAAALTAPAAARGERAGPVAAVVDLGARRGPEDDRQQAEAPDGRLAIVVPLAPRQATADKQTGPAHAPDTGQPPGRGPPPGGPTSTGTARSSTAAPAAGTPAEASGRVVVLADRRRVSVRAPPAGGPHDASPAPEQGAAPEPEVPVVLAFKARATTVAAYQVAHTRGRAAAANAQEASRPEPELELPGKAAGNNVATMDAATEEPVPFDAESFKVAVRAAVDRIAPPANLEEADNFEESGKAGEAAVIAQGLVKSGQTATERPIATTTAAPLDTGGLTGKHVGELDNDRVGGRPESAGAASVVPAAKSDVAVDLSAGSRSVDDAMTAQDITVPQLTEADEPRFTAALEARQAVADQAAAAVPAYRAEEGALLPATAAALGAEETAAFSGMHTARLGVLHRTARTKDQTRDDDARRRDDVSGSLLHIHQQTKQSVEWILHALDTTVARMFTEGESDARYTFEHYVAFKMEEYKRDRYGGFGGGALWLHDTLFALPEEVNRFYETGRSFYLTKLDRTIDSIAGVIGVSLAMATMAIRIGRARVQHLLTTLPDDLVQLGVRTARQLDQRFDLLASGVGAARDHLVDVVARSYVDASKKLDDRITELEEENQGLATRAVEFAEEVGHTIAELGRLLGRVLLKAASVIGSILRHPIRFFGHLVDAVGAGLDLFTSRIGRHLEEALLDLLFGHLARSGLTLPTSLDFAGIFDLVCQVLQIRWVDLRARLVERLGLDAVLRMEQLVDVFRLLADRGIGGLWKLVLQRLAELPDLVIGVLRRYVVEQVVKEGIAYIASLLTPASAFIKACQGIYRIVSFVVEKARQIADFVDAVLDSMAAIAAGDVTAAAEKIDAALAGTLKLAIGFLAKLVHLDAISDKVHSVIDRIRTPVRRTVDAIIDGAVSLYQRTVGAEPGRGAARTPADAKPAVAAARSRGADAEAEKSAARAALPPESRLPDTIDEPIRIGGEIHHLKNDGPGGVLALHTSTVLVNRISDPQLQSLVTEFNTATTKKGRHAAALMVARWIADNMPAGSPGGSAPNIGKIERHGRQPPRLRNVGVPLWSLESEHVVPFDVIRGLGEVLGTQGRAKRGVLNAEDRALTTIAIYERAADYKTRQEVSRRNRLSNEFTAMAERFASRPDYNEPAANATMRAWVMRSLRREGSWYVDLTWQGIQHEHAMAEAGSIRGALRVEPTPLPGLAEIGAAADQELADAARIVDSALTELERP